MAANLRDFVLTNCDGKEVYDSLMQLHYVIYYLEVYFSSKFLV
jgi:hypothetical protein